MGWLTRPGWLLGVSALAVGATAYGSRRWAARTRELISRIEAARIVPNPSRYDAHELEGLPPPVQRYFRCALVDGAPIVAAATMRHAGVFNMSETAEQWKPFRSTQRVVTRRPGFVWDGRIAFVPGLALHVHDAYVAGEGILQAAAAGLYTLAELRGSPEMGQGELLRFLAEAAWFPTALLPSQGVAWQALDERSARATLVDAPHMVTLTVRFRDDGLIESVHAAERGRTVAGHLTPTAWQGRWSDYERRAGMMVPASGEVAWLPPAGRLPYWRGTVASSDYEFAA